MANVGYATLQVIPSLRGFETKVKQQLPGSASLGGAGAAAGRSYGSRFSSTVGGMVRGLGNTITSSLTAAAGVAAVGIGTALTSGFARVTAIEDATAALTISLGDSAAAGQLLGDVLDVIRGTPFNLDQFATAAQRLAGMGIEAQKIPTYLEAIGEASATQGKRSGEFVERLVRVFGQISAQGRIMGEDILQLSEAGVNALAILGNHFGVTTSEMRDMVSRGAVPAQEALDVLAEGILNGSDGVAGATVALGGTMASLRQTLSGSIGGFGAALARFGASIITPLTPLLTKVFQAGATLLDALGEKITDFGATIQDRFPIFDQLVQFLENMPEAVGPLIDRLGDLGPAIAPVAGAIAGLASTRLAGALGPLGMFVPTLNPLVGIFAGLVAVSPELRDALMDAFATVAPVVRDLAATLLPQLVPAMQAIGAAIAGVLPHLVQAGVAILEALLPGIVALLPAVTALAPVLASVASALASVIAAAPPGVIQAIVVAFLAFRGVSAATTAVRSLRTTITDTVGTIRNARSAVSRFFAEGGGGGKVRSAFQAVGRAASGAVSGIRNAATALAGYARSAAIATASALRTAAAWVAQRVAAIASTVATHAMTAAQAALNVVLSLNPITLVVLAIAGLIAALVLAYHHVGWFRDFVDASFRAVLGAVTAVWNWVKSNWPLLLAILTGPIGLAVLAIVRNWDTIKDAVTGVRDWIKARWDDVISFLTGLPGRVTSAVSGMWDSIRDGFKGVINRIIGWWNSLSFTIGGGTYDPLGRFGPSITVPSFTFHTPDIPLRLHTGGIFRTPNGQREGLALLEDGEGVFTSDQMAELGRLAGAGGNGTAEIRVTGSGPLAEFFHKAVRTGDIQLYVDGRPVTVNR